MLLAALLWIATPFAEQARGVFRTDVDLVHLHVIATDGKGRRMTGLDKHAFVVLEDRAPQRVEFFAAENIAVDLAVLLDTSGSMAPFMPQVRDAARGFVRSFARCEM